MKEESSIFWRLNPGNADHFGKLKDVYVRSPKLYETDSLRQLGKDLNESRKKLRKQGLLAMPNFWHGQWQSHLSLLINIIITSQKSCLMVQDFM